MPKKNAFETLKDLLISLKPDEKRDFKKASTFWAANDKTTVKYLLLYELLNEALKEDPDFDQDQFLKRKKVAKSFTRDQLFETGSTLYSNLLKNLRAPAHVGRSRREVQNCLSTIHFLYHKRLFDAMYDWLEKGKKLADKYELYYYKMELLFWERKLFFAWKRGNFVTMTEDVAVLEHQTIELISLQTKLQAMFSLFRGFMTAKNAVEFEKVQAQIQVLDKNYDLWAEQLSSNLFASRILHHCASTAARILLESAEKPDIFLGQVLNHHLRLFHQEKAILIMDKMNMKEEDPHAFYRVVSDYFAHCVQFGEFDRASKVESLLPDDPASPDFLEFTAYSKLLFFFKKEQFVEGRKFLEANQIGHFLDNDAVKIANSRVQYISFYSALIYYKCNEFKKADQFFQRLNEGEKSGPVLVLSILSRFVEVFIEVKRETHLVGKTFYDKIIKELKVLLENAGQFSGFNEAMWDTLKMMGKDPNLAFSEANLGKLNAEAMLSVHIEMNQMLVTWFMELKK